MGFAQHFFRISNSPKNKFAPAGVSGGAIHRLGETVVQILSQTPHPITFHTNSLFLSSLPRTMWEDVVQIAPWEVVLHNTSHQLHIRRYNSYLHILID